jgi:myo-inositol 2-dehydrogenase/D-chiro-inositol 1-dehydrogenase/scyllo-inositol 2-dehydrogenase (NAD+)
MIEACAKAGVKLQLGFMRRFDRSFRRGKEMLEEGIVGNPTMIKSNTYGPSEPKEWMYDIHKNSGPIGEVNSHDFDTLRWYAGSEVKMIHAIGGNFRSQNKAEEYPDYYDTCSVRLEFENGVLGVITGAQYVCYGYDSRAEILGTNGIIKVGSQHADSAEAVTMDKVIRADSMDSWRTLFLDAYRAEAQAFIDCIVNDTEPPVTGKDGKMALVLVNEGLRSLLEHRPVYLKNGLPEE